MIRVGVSFESNYYVSLVGYAIGLTLLEQNQIQNLSPFHSTFPSCVATSLFGYLLANEAFLSLGQFSDTADLENAGSRLAGGSHYPKGS